MKGNRKEFELPFPYNSDTPRYSLNFEILLKSCSSRLSEAEIEALSNTLNTFPMIFSKISFAYQNLSDQSAVILSERFLQVNYFCFNQF